MKVLQNLFIELQKAMQVLYKTQCRPDHLLFAEDITPKTVALGDLPVVTTQTAFFITIEHGAINETH